MSINIREVQPTTVGLQLARLRQSKGISRADVAFRLQVCKSTVACIEQGHSQLPLAQYRAYCQAIGICPLRAMRQLKLAETPAVPRIQPLLQPRRGICERFGLRKRNKQYCWMWGDVAVVRKAGIKVALQRVEMKKYTEQEEISI